MAHTLGAVYDTPHGVACAMMLPIVMEYNADCTGEKYREIARAMGVEGVDSMTQAEYRRAAIDAVKKLSRMSASGEAGCSEGRGPSLPC